MNDPLRILREADANRSASDAVERNLREAFRRQHTAVRRPLWLVSAAAALLIAVIGWEQADNVARPPAVVQQRAAQAPEELEFLALPFAPPYQPDQGAQVIRVRVPRQSLHDIGVFVNDSRMGDQVPADLLLGYDGIARGIRLVSELPE